MNLKPASVHYLFVMFPAETPQGFTLPNKNLSILFSNIIKGWLMIAVLDKITVHVSNDF